MTKVSAKRHIAKALTWRAIATLTTISLTWIFSGSSEIALKVGLVDVSIKLLFYFLHERAWYKYSKFGVKENEKLDKNTESQN